MTDYQDVRKNLLNMLEDLDLRLTKITDDIKHTDAPISPDFEEQAQETENNEVLDALGNASRLEVEKIKEALNRIDAGTYGICQSCGEAIKAERLAVVPYAKFCINCEKTHTQ
jgi:DnaK suppressor protein